ncbi:helix-turn-helix transcriptional regulator [Endozoicomonas sp. 4G]|uniref:helix-turn-helix domain-containing protein n=1 Tax=Endozoicomonas sp. 4G TaxID=2872754 RepID=UPI00207871D3|nr:helix-turn-helix transcriptional regulator [Endozoicomonas sp. 4G]
MLTNIDIGRAIDHLMVDRGYNQKQLAERAGEMDTANLNRIIKGKQAATTDRLEAIAKALDVKVWEIYRLAEDGQPPRRETHGRPRCMS